jgi:molybdopterin-guanine dinucleotide biosynthesis protein A
MGAEKALIRFRGRPLVLWPMSVLDKVAQELIISVSPAPSEGLLETLGPSIIIVKDERHGKGPLHGLFSSFRVANGEYVAVAPCDSPFIEAGLFEMLFSRAEGRGGAVPMVDGYYEPLIAVYHRASFLDALERTIDGGKAKPVDTYPLMDLAFVDQQDILDAGLSLDSFVNFNVTEDLKRYDESTTVDG